MIKGLKSELKYRWILRNAAPGECDQKKYGISVCQIFKDEAPYLREWLEYHLLIGIDHFYFYDNNSSDEFERVLAPYIDKGIVTLISWPPLAAQVAAYEDCIKRFREESEWIGFLDVDEFVVPVAASSFPAFLKGFSIRPSVVLYWRFFGSEGRIDRDRTGLVTEDFVVASEKLFAKGKCFYNTRFDYLWGSERNQSMFHRFWSSVNGKPVPPVDAFGRFFIDDYPRPTRKEIPVQLNHYALKSFLEHRNKNLKGDVYYTKPTHSDELFFLRDERCSVPDYRIYKYLTRLKHRLANDGKDPE
ncbi:MAG: glycosyltransferase family 92 protein [Bacteroidales bacterium]|nr:glycosyltransferase family 92 protein [Bacteroidales bacterium]